MSFLSNSNGRKCEKMQVQRKNGRKPRRKKSLVHYNILKDFVQTSFGRLTARGEPFWANSPNLKNHDFRPKGPWT